MSEYQEQCGDNRFEIIEETKNYIINATNIETSIEEMKVLDNFCFRLWQLGLTKRNKDKLKILEEKEKPKKLIETTSYGTTRARKCFICNKKWSTSNQTKYKYCPNCGQKLDWSAVKKITNNGVE